MSRKELHVLDADEDERQRLLGELISEEGEDWATQYKPGSLGCHELLDRTAMIADLLERHVLTHPACLQNESWYRLAARAAAALQELYQAVGESHLGAK